jgi:ribosomal protein L34E
MKIAGKNKKCPKCGDSFQCLGDEDCWCESYQILQKDFLRITQAYNDCLCPECLKEYTSE